jgi:hypothetical protein
VVESSTGAEEIRRLQVEVQDVKQKLLAKLATHAARPKAQTESSFINHAAMGGFRKDIYGI